MNTTLERLHATALSADSKSRIAFNCWKEHPGEFTQGMAERAADLALEAWRKLAEAEQQGIEA
jgi:hypothetical protein